MGADPGAFPGTRGARLGAALSTLGVFACLTTSLPTDALMPRSTCVCTRMLAVEDFIARMLTMLRPTWG